MKWHKAISVINLRFKEEKFPGRVGSDNVAIVCSRTVRARSCELFRFEISIGAALASWHRANLGTRGLDKFSPTKREGADDHMYSSNYVEQTKIRLKSGLFIQNYFRPQHVQYTGSLCPHPLKQRKQAIVVYMRNQRTNKKRRRSKRDE